MRVRYAAVLPTLLDDLDTRQTVALDSLYARLGPHGRMMGRINLPWLSQITNQFEEQPQAGDVVAFAKVGDNHACAKVTQRLWVPSNGEMGLVVVLDLAPVAERIDGVHVRRQLAEDGWHPDIRFRW